MPTASTCCSAGSKVIIALAAVLFILHHDFWWWNDGSIALGFIPVGLLYHGVYSLAVAALWFLAVRIAWPARLERWADEVDGSAPAATDAGPNQAKASEADA